MKQLQSKQKINLVPRSGLFLVLAVLSLFSIVNFSTINCALAQYGGNNFFGTSPGSPGGMTAPGSSPGSGSSSGSTDYSKDLPEDSNPNAVLPGLNETNPNTAAMGTDFSGDEKRMQKRYKANLINAKKLIDKGEGMMASAGKNPNNAEYKKGKILKETGEKWLVQLKSNNPVPEQKK